MSGRRSGVPRLAWVTLAAVLVVGAAVTVGLVVFAGDGGSPAGGNGASSPLDDPGVTPQPVEWNDSPYRVPRERGVTGKNVSVGVLDVTGFDANDPAIRRQVRAIRSFRNGGGVRPGRTEAHGTAAASIVTSVAPDADLYLASFDSPANFRRAVAWLLRQDVDVVVAPVSVYGQVDDGTSAVSRAARRAADRGVVFVAPVGNLARGHWQGRYEDVEEGRLQFASDEPVDRRTVGAEVPGEARNYVRGGDREFTLWLSWDEAHADEDYTAVLHRVNGSTSEVVARSTPYEGDRSPNERIRATLGDGTYFVTVRGPNGSTGARLELSTPTHRLSRGNPRGSIAAPATARGVVAVGAYDTSRDRVARFSSRGPTADGRPGVDVVAPERYRTDNRTRLVGSSAAAPYVAGVAALIRARNPGIAPARVEMTLESTAVDVGKPGYDYATGHGAVAPWRAVRVASDGVATNATRSPDGRRLNRRLSESNAV